MRTTLDLNESLVHEAMAVSPGRTKTSVIEEALREYARRRRLERYRELEGQFRWEGDLDELRGRVPRS